MNSDHVRELLAIGPQRPYLSQLIERETQIFIRSLWRELPTLMRCARVFYGRRIRPISLFTWLWKVAEESGENINPEEQMTNIWRRLRAEAARQRAYFDDVMLVMALWGNEVLENNSYRRLVRLIRPRPRVPVPSYQYCSLPPSRRTLRAIRM